jgi:hypothetical protein
MLSASCINALTTMGFPAQIGENGDCTLEGSDIFGAVSVRYNLLEGLFRIIDRALFNMEMGESDSPSSEDDKRLTKLGKIAEIMALAPIGQGNALVTGGDKSVTARKFLEVVISTAETAYQFDLAPNPEEMARAEESSRSIMNEVTKRAGVKTSGSLFSHSINAHLHIPTHISNEIAKRRVESSMTVSFPHTPMQHTTERFDSFAS